ncbi:MAG TPA: hypothetical protein VL501_06870 [Pyrinomonadaceae bacterium]|nr:hypothetical protein [Pyrinomonadaceae bacterium]
MRGSARNWTEFDEPAPRIIPEDRRASINYTGEITFDLATFKQLGEPRAMVLLYEESTRTIGLKPADPSAQNAVLVRARHKKSNRVVRSIPFLKRNKIEIEGYMRFPYPHIEDGVLVLDLRTIVTSSQGGWRRTRGQH